VLAPAAFAVLVIATVAAFAVAQRLKREPLVLDKVAIGPMTRHGDVVFSPNGDRIKDRARIKFRVTRSDHATVQILDGRGHLVRTLARDRYLPAFRLFVFRWNGRTGTGARAPTGPYRARVQLLGQDRSLDLNPRIRLHDLSLVPPALRPKPARPQGGGTHGAAGGGGAG
jgi:FlgD Ig-like domain